MQTPENNNNIKIKDPTVMIIKYLNVAMKVVLIGILSILTLYYLSVFINIPSIESILKILEYILLTVIISFPIVVSTILLITYIINKNKKGVMLGSSILISLIISFVSAILVER